MEVSPPEPEAVDYFLHVLTATDSEASSVPQATAQVTGTKVTVMIGGTTLTFTTKDLGGWIEISGTRSMFAKTIVD